MNSKYIYEEIGRLINNRRKQMKMTQKDLSERVKVSRASIANIEAGRQRILIHQLYKLASVLEIEPSDMLPKATSTTERKADKTNINLPENILTEKQREQVLNLFHDDFGGD